MTEAAPALIELPIDTTPVPLAAEIYAALGFNVIPLHGVTSDGKCTCGSSECEPRSAGKHPIGRSWQKQATSNLDEVRELFRGHHWNIGIMLGYGLVVLDVDGPKGFESLRELGELPITLTSRSGSGEGEHQVFAYAQHQDPAEVTNRMFMPKLDCKTRSGQIVVAPSLHRSGRRYEWTQHVMPAVLPDHVYERLRKPKRAPVVSLPTCGASELYERARSYAAKFDPAISGSGGHAAAFAAARSLAGWVAKGLSQAEGWSLLCDYNNRCQPPWGEHELKHKWDNALGAHTLPEIKDRPRASVTPIRRGVRIPEREARDAIDPDPEPAEPTITTEPAPTTSGGGGGGARPEASWKSRMIWEETSKGSMRPAKHTENAIVILRYHPAWAGKVRLDTHAQTITVTDPPWHESDKPSDSSGVRPWTDGDTVRLSAWIRREVSVDLSVDACDRAVSVAADSSPYHPVRDWMLSLEWDGTSRLANACENYFGTPPTLFTKMVLRWWMIAAVARTFDPGCKADNVLILEGSQGLRKSAALRVLASPKWFTDTPIDLQSKDAFLALNGKLIVELAELATLRKADFNRAKSFFSSAEDNYRPPYGRRNVTVPRGCVFAGSVNPDSPYLHDPTGNRRYWPVFCSKVDLEGLERDRAQLWAEARTLFHDGALWWPTTTEELQACEEAQQRRSEEDAWEHSIASYLGRHLGLQPTIGEVMKDALDIPKDKWARPEQMRVSSIMQRLGFSRRQVREHGGRTWRYCKEEAPAL